MLVSLQLRGLGLHEAIKGGSPWLRWQFTMAVVARLAWLRSQAASGTTSMSMHFSYDPEVQKTKIRFTLSPLGAASVDFVPSDVILNTIDTISSSAISHIVMDGGHRFSDGRSEVSVWLQKHRFSAGGGAALAPVPSQWMASEPLLLSRVVVESSTYDADIESMCPIDSHLAADLEQLNGTITPSFPDGDPEGGRATDATGLAEPVVLKSEAASIGEAIASGWRTVVANFDTFLEALRGVEASAQNACVDEATVECLAMQGHALTKLESGFNIEGHLLSQAVRVEIELRQQEIWVAMDKSDAMKQRIISLLTGASRPTAGAATSASASPVPDAVGPPGKKRKTKRGKGKS